jgi:hypothetical protein
LQFDVPILQFGEIQDIINQVCQPHPTRDDHGKIGFLSVIEFTRRTIE